MSFLSVQLGLLHGLLACIVAAAPPPVVPILSSATTCISMTTVYAHGLLPPGHAVCEDFNVGLAHLLQQMNMWL